MHVSFEDRPFLSVHFGRNRAAALYAPFQRLWAAMDFHRLVAVGLLLLPLLALAGPGAAHAQDVIVDDDGQAALPQNCGGSNSAPSTIGDGVTNASAGQTVFVCPGTYTENVTIGKGITLNGNNAGTAGNDNSRGSSESIVNGQDGIGFKISTTAAVTVDGFEFIGDEGVVRLGGGSMQGQLDVRNNRFLNDERGVVLKNFTAGGNVTVADNFTDLTQGTYTVSPTRQQGSEIGTVGIELRTIDGSGSVSVSNNDFSDGGDSGSESAFYGIIFDGVKPDSRASISGGTIDGTAQAIAVLDGQEGLQLEIEDQDDTDLNGTQRVKESFFDISGVTATRFTGSSGNGSIDQHNGIFVFTGGEPASQVTSDGTISNVTMNNTGIAGGGAPSAGLYFGGFGTQFGNGNFDQSVTVTNATVQDNDNRGVFVRGADVVATVEQSTITGNGDAPVGSGGNAGFGVIAREGGDLTVKQSEITNPSSSTDFGSSLQSQNTQTTNSTILTVMNSRIDRNGLGNLISGSEPVQASGNAWLDGSILTAPGQLTNLITNGTADYTPFLNNASDQDGSTAGFQGDFSTLNIDNASPQIGNKTRYQEAIDLADARGITNPAITPFQTGSNTYDEFAVDANTDFTGVSGPVQVTTLTYNGQPSSLVDFDVETIDINSGSFPSNSNTITVTNGEIDVAQSVSSISNSPTFDVQNQFEGKSGTGNDTGWRVLSSPRASTDGADLNDLDFSTDTGSILHTWDGANQEFVAGDNTSSTALPSGKGFLLYFFDDDTESVEPSSPITLDVTGTLTTGSPFESSDKFGTGNRSVDIPATPTGDEGATGYLLGVPYAQSFDLSDLVLQGNGTIGTNGEFKGVVQAWDPTAGTDGQFVQITEAGDNSDLIAPWQGFWLERNQATTTDQAETLVFESEGRSSGAPFIGRKAAATSETGRLAVQLRLEDSQGTVLSDSRSTLYLRTGASTGPDAYDAARIAPPMDEYAQVSFVAEDESRQAQLSLPYDLTQRVTRGLHVEAAGLSGTGVLTAPDWTNVPDSWTITLTDTQQDTTFALTEDTEYRFDLTSTKTLSTNSDSGPGGGPQEGSVSGRFALTLAPSGTLPVELTTFDGALVEDDVRLSWRTASEQNNDGFRIQRAVGSSGEPGPSDEEEEWNTIGAVEGAGTTSQPQTYTFTDTNLPYAADAVRYRLRQVDTDGSTSYSDPVTIERGGPEQVALLGTYPNPARQRATVRFAVPDSRRDASGQGQVQLKLYDVLGRSVRTVETKVEPGRHEHALDVSGLTSGVYVLRLQVGPTTETQKLTIVQ